MLPGFIRIVGGTLNKDLMEETTFDSSLMSIRPHPGYNFRSRAYNLAVVRVSAFFILLFLKTRTSRPLQNQQIKMNSSDGKSNPSKDLQPKDDQVGQ